MKRLYFPKAAWLDLSMTPYTYDPSRIQRHQKETISPYSEMLEKDRDLMKCQMILFFFFFFWRVPQQLNPSTLFSLKNRSFKIEVKNFSHFILWYFIFQGPLLF